MVKMSLVLKGKTEGISNTGEVFSEEELDFSAGGTVDELQISQSYVNYMGTWAYTMKCPVVKDGREIAALYIEYTYDLLRIFCHCNFLGDQLLKIRLIFQNSFYRAFYQIQALAEILYGRRFILNIRTTILTSPCPMDFIISRQCSILWMQNQKNSY